MTSLEMYKTTECDCDRCSEMCQAPCLGTPKEIQAIVDAGYGERLCYDDWQSNTPADIHPAIKGFEGGRASYETSSPLGCTFWKDGKCELHDKGLKPFGGKFAHHDQSYDHYQEGMNIMLKEWDTPEGLQVYNNWKKNFIKEDDE